MSEKMTKAQYQAELAKAHQPTLGGITRRDSANMGAEFEEELNHIHEIYRRAGLVYVVKNLSDWEICKGRDYHIYKDRFDKKDARSAKTGDGKIMRRLLSEVDFTGGGFGFDAKETKENAFPLSSVEEHQINSLTAARKCGDLTGLMIKFTAHNRVFFAPIEFVVDKIHLWQKSQRESTAKNRAAAPGTASISIKELEEFGHEIKRNSAENWDWLRVLAELKKK